ncbi:hypothetical protein D3C84_1221750 [compost metagenome]
MENEKVIFSKIDTIALRKALMSPSIAFIGLPEELISLPPTQAGKSPKNGTATDIYQPILNAQAVITAIFNIEKTIS